MAKKSTIKPLAAAIGTTFVVSLAASSVTSAATNPFAMNELSSGYMVAEETGKCGTLCGGTTPTMNKDGEMAKCGNICGEVQKCGTLCGGVSGANPERSESQDSDKNADVQKCGTICAAMTKAN